jgi:hypothetical protein
MLEEPAAENLHGGIAFFLVKSGDKFLHELLVPAGIRDEDLCHERPLSESQK